MNTPLSSPGVAAERSSNRNLQLLVLLSPIAVTAMGQLLSRIIGPLLGTWSWLPLTIGYWIATGFLAIWGGGKQAVSRWLQVSQGGLTWPLIALIFAVAPALPMLVPSWRFFLEARVWIPTVFFVLINPCAEEGYWRGLLIDTASMAGWRTWQAVTYSSLFFTLNHSWMAVMVVGARNPAAWVFQFLFGIIMSITYLKTRSLRWPIFAHFLTNLLTPTVAVLLNLYIPG